MAKLPGWMKFEQGPAVRGLDGHWYMQGRLTIRQWHPGWWLFVIRVLLSKDRC